MPDYFSHFICAEKVFERLDSASKAKINSNTLYLLGAQGGDVFFAYNFKLSKNNLGRTMHDTDPKELFSILASANPSYAAGFATHYALDCTLHPLVYAFEASHSSPFAHQKFESDMGLFISKFFGIRRRILPRDKILSCTGVIYDSVKAFEPSITVTGVERCLKRHFDYTRYLYKTKRQSYKTAYDFTSVTGAIEEGIELGIKAIKCVLSQHIDGSIFEKSFLQH